MSTQSFSGVNNPVVFNVDIEYITFSPNDNSYFNERRNETNLVPGNQETDEHMVPHLFLQH